MNRLIHWLQTNPVALLVMFAVSFLSGIAGLVLGWKQLYEDYLSKSVEIPVWLMLVSLAILPIVFAAARNLAGVRREKGPTKIEGKRFGVQRIVADGLLFERCEFHGTEIVFRAERAFGFEHCTFNGHRFLFDGPAALMLQAMTKMYKTDSGFRPFVEQLINDIKEDLIPTGVPPAEL